MNHRTAMLTDQIGENIQENQREWMILIVWSRMPFIHKGHGKYSESKRVRYHYIFNKELTEQIHEIDKVAEIIRIKSGGC